MMTTPSSAKLLVPSLLLVLAACGQDEAPDGPGGAPESGRAATPAVTAQMTGYEVQVADLPAGGNCSLDAINGAAAADPRVATGSDTVFSGWMANDDGQVPGTARLVLSSDSGSYSVPVTAGVERPDVAQALGQPGLARSGFDIETRVDAVPGEYGLFIVHEDATEQACRLNVQLVVE